MGYSGSHDCKNRTLKALHCYFLCLWKRHSKSPFLVALHVVEKGCAFSIGNYEAGLDAERCCTVTDKKLFWKLG